MENKPDITVTGKTGWLLNLLPHRFRWMGICIIVAILPLLFVIQSKALNSVLREALIVGLFFVAWSKDKVEDEKSLLVRLRDICYCVGMFIMLNVLYSVLASNYRSAITAITGDGFIILLLGTLILFNFSKKRSLKA